jgi:hypothetical protein
MKNRGQKAQKLKLNRETLRVLEGVQLLGPVGGVTTTTTTTGGSVAQGCTVTRSDCGTSQGVGCGHPTTTSELC